MRQNTVRWFGSDPEKNLVAHHMCLQYSRDQISPIFLWFQANIRQIWTKFSKFLAALTFFSGNIFSIGQKILNSTISLRQTPEYGL